jgi:hypothetical protein
VSSRSKSWFYLLGAAILIVSVSLALNMRRTLVWWYMRHASDPSIRAEETLAAEERLAQLGSKAAPHIERYLRDRDNGRRRVAANALVRIGAARSMPAFVAACLDERDDIQKGWLLGDIAQHNTTDGGRAVSSQRGEHGCEPSGLPRARSRGRSRVTPRAGPPARRGTAEVT